MKGVAFELDLLVADVNLGEEDWRWHRIPHE
jgi:hypothetical protein